MCQVELVQHCQVEPHPLEIAGVNIKTEIVENKFLAFAFVFMMINFCVCKKSHLPNQLIWKLRSSVSYDVIRNNDFLYS